MNWSAPIVLYRSYPAFISHVDCWYLVPRAGVAWVARAEYSGYLFGDTLAGPARMPTLLDSSVSTGFAIHFNADATLPSVNLAIHATFVVLLRAVPRVASCC